MIFLFLYKKLGNIGYETKKKGEDILSRWRRLLSTIWMKFVPVAPRYLEFRLMGGKKFTFKLPKVPDLAKCLKKRQKLFYYFGNLKSEGLKLCIEFAYSFRQTLGKSDSKKPIKNRDQTFYWSSFPTPQQFLLFWLRYQCTHFSSFLGRSIR